VLSAPSIWAMLFAFRFTEKSSVRRLNFPRGGALLISRLLTVGLVGLLSIRFFPALITLIITFIVCVGIFILFRNQVEIYYRWMELQFKSGFQADLAHNTHKDETHSRLAPWDAHLVEIKVPAHSFVVGCTLLDLKFREKYGLNVVVIVRDQENMVA